MRKKQNFLGDLFNFYARYQMPVILCQFDLSIVFYNQEAACIFPDMKVGDFLSQALGTSSLPSLKTPHIFYLSDHTPCMIHPLADPMGGVYYAVEIQAQPSHDKTLFSNHRLLAFLSHLSHEIGTPLTLLCSSLSMIQRYSGQNSQKTDHYIKASIGYYYRLSRLVSHFLSLSDLYKKGKPALQTRTIDMVSFLNTLCDAFYTTNHQYDTPIEFSSSLTECLCDIDPFLMERVLLNLLYNACKYAKEGNAVTVTVEQKEQNAVISVTDRGNGISPAIAKALMGEGELDPSRYSPSGHGIGLQIVKFYVDVHDGRIEVKSTRGRGSTISIYLSLSGASPSLKTPFIFDLEHFRTANLEEGSTP
jgi:signal transduction histidine kinase